METVEREARQRGRRISLQFSDFNLGGIWVKQQLHCEWVCIWENEGKIGEKEREIDIREGFDRGLSIYHILSDVDLSLFLTILPSFSQAHAHS